MAGYVKLFEEILDSSIWQEDHPTVRVWITILAMKGKDDIVKAALPGLAHRAMVSLEECQKAVNKFISPDPYSRSKAFEGRRLKEVDGGWLVLNGQKYREKLNLEERRAYWREKQREHRQRLGKVKKSISLREKLAEEECESVTVNDTKATGISGVS